MFDVIVNPCAGKGKPLEALKKLESLFQERKVEYAVHKTEHAGHATEMVAELTKNGTNLIVLGGDGTFNEVLNGIVDFDNTVVGFVPCGTGNDYVKAAKLPTDPNIIFEKILKGETGYTDFIQMNGRRCLNVVGGGMDTDVLVRYSTMKAFKGKAKYYASLLSVLSHLKFHKIRFSVDDGEPVEKSVFLISIANGIYIGGGMPISPESKVDDGVLNVVAINEIKKSKVLGSLLKFLKGKHIYEPYTEQYLCKKAKIEVLDDGYVQADGEVLKEKMLDCEIRHQVLKIYI